MITLHDFVMLGSTVPQATKDGRVFVCTAGYSSDLGLVRLYPLPQRGVPRRWERHSIDVERNPRDSRPESWRLAHDREPAVHATANRHFRPQGTIAPSQRSTLVPEKYWVDSVQEANERRLSLALLRPARFDITWTRLDGRPAARHDRWQHPDQLELLPELWPHRHDPEPLVPRLSFDDHGGHHRLQLRDWGTYRLIETKGQQYATEHLRTALHLGPRSALLIGNLSNQRTSWLVISVLNIIAEQTVIDLGHGVGIDRITA